VVLGVAALGSYSMLAADRPRSELVVQMNYRSHHETAAPMKQRRAATYAPVLEAFASRTGLSFSTERSEFVSAFYEDKEAIAELRNATQVWMRAKQTLEDGQRSVFLNNARELSRNHFELSGFDLISHSSSISDFSDAEQVRGKYYEELEKLVTRITGADHSFCCNHWIRQSGQNQSDKDPSLEELL
jgi:hypothetical protein